MVETAKYEVILKEDEFEIRKYESMLVATVRDAPSKFQVLFRYITGSNMSRSKIDMTSPVITAEKIAMTAPVLSNRDTMSFVVPAEYDEDSVPEPTDPRVSIDKVPERYVATVRFRGLAWKDSVKKQTAKLIKKLEEKGITMKGSPFLMQYNPPYIPSFLRRNEVGVEIEFDG